MFKTANTYPIVSFLTFNGYINNDYQLSIGKYNVKTARIDYKLVHSDKLGLLEGYIWGHLLNDKLAITERVIATSKPIAACAKIKATSTASDEYHSLINESGGYKLINTGTIDRYSTTWGKEYLTDKGQKYLKPYLPVNDARISRNRHRLYSSSKIILAKIAISTEAFFDENGEYASVNTNCFHSFDLEYDPKYILAWLNSKLFQYTFQCFFDGLKMQGGYLLYSAPNISKMYIKKPSVETQKAFNYLVSYILFLNAMRKSPEVELLGLSHLHQLFDEIVDAMIYQVYFENDFEIAGIEFY